MQNLLLLTIRDDADPEDVKPLLKEEARRTWELHAAGVTRSVYFRGDKLGAVSFIEADDVEAARETVGTLPLVRSGLFDVEVIPLKPYTGFDVLFAQKAGPGATG